MTLTPAFEVAQALIEEAERIARKEEIYRNLIAENAKAEGRTFEEMFQIIKAEKELVNAKYEEFYERRAKKEGISAYEVKLDMNIGSLALWVKVFKCCGKPKPEFAPTNEDIKARLEEIETLRRDAAKRQGFPTLKAGIN